MGKYVLGIFIGGIVFVILLQLDLSTISSLVLTFFIVGIPALIMNSKEEPVGQDQDCYGHWYRKF